MRLINADDVKDLINGLDSLPWEDQVDEMVDAIPTAYDVGEVLKQIHDELYCYDIPNNLLDDIVKRGGRE